MNLIIAGKNNIAVDVLEYALTIKNLKIFIVLNKTENFSNGFQKSLGFYSKLWQVKIISLEDSYKLDNAIFLSLEFDRIIKPELFKCKQLINIHFSKLPAYKGMFTSALPILNGDIESGVTLHLIDKGIDTGDIIEQISFNLEDNETARSLYFKYLEKGTALVIKNLHNLIENNYTVYPQNAYKSSYYGKDSIDYSNVKINLRRTAYQINQQLRAFTFREYQMPRVNGFAIGNWEISSKKSTQRPGFIKELDKYNFLVSTIDYDIKLTIDFYELLWEYCRINDTDSLREVLHNRDLDLEVKTKEGWTALIIAVYNGSFECAKLLLQEGANPNAQNYNKTTVLMYAKSNVLKTKNYNIINLLLTFGADINLKDVFNKTVIDWAKEEDIELYNLFNNKV